MAHGERARGRWRHGALVDCVSGGGGALRLHLAARCGAAVVRRPTAAAERAGARTRVPPPRAAGRGATDRRGGARARCRSGCGDPGGKRAGGRQAPGGVGVRGGAISAGGAAARGRLCRAPRRRTQGESLLARGWPPQVARDVAAEGPRGAPGAREAGALVRAVGLTRRFGDFVAADRIGFEVRAGEIYGLLGPNGAGKSTTFRMLCGLLKPTEGDASVAGVNLLHAASRARARLGYMAQKFSLYGDLSVGQNLDYFADIYGLSRAAKRERVTTMVEMFELAPHLDSNASLLPLG